MQTGHIYMGSGFRLSEALHYLVIRRIYLKGINVKFWVEVAHTGFLVFLFWFFGVLVVLVFLLAPPNSGRKLIP